MALVGDDLGQKMLDDYKAAGKLDGVTAEQEAETLVNLKLMGNSIVDYVVANMEVKGVAVDSGTHIQNNDGTGRIA